MYDIICDLINRRKNLNSNNNKLNQYSCINNIFYCVNPYVIFMLLMSFVKIEIKRGKISILIKIKIKIQNI